MCREKEPESAILRSMAGPSVDRAPGRQELIQSWDRFVRKEGEGNINYI